MKILLLTQWFDPEPTFKGLPFAKELKSLGHDVEVLTGFPNYPGGKVYSGYKISLYQKDVMDGIVIHRVALYPDHGKSALKRVFNYISFCLTSLLVGVFKLPKYDIIYAYHPPLTTGISSMFMSFFRRTPVVLDIQDLWPDTLAATGMLSNTKLLSIVAWFCKRVYNSAAHIAVLSPGFKDKLTERGVPESKLSVIYNWCDESSIENFESCSYKLPENGFNLVFAGNLGHAQGLPALIEAAKIVNESGVVANFVFVGDGVSKLDAKILADSYKLNNVYFIPRVPVSEVGQLLNSADALLVHLLDDELFRITIPSRTQAYLCIGKPILMAVKGDAADLIEKSKSGLIAEPNNPNSIADTLICLVRMSQNERVELSRNAKDFYHKNLSLKKGVQSFSDLFSRIVK